MLRGALPYAYLLALAGLLQLLTVMVGDGATYFSFYRPEHSPLSGLVLFPLVVALCILARRVFRLGEHPGLEACLYVLLYLLMVRHAAGFAAVLVTFAAFYWAEKKLPRGTAWNSLFVLAGGLFLYLKVYLYFVEPEFFHREIWTTALVREVFGTRLFSWIVYRRVLRGERFHGPADFFGYMFSPVFFVLPNVLDGVPFHYYHEKKRQFGSREFRKAAFIGAWGFGFVALHYFWQANLYRPILLPFLWERWGRIDHWFLLGGFFSLVANVIKVTAGMSLQVAMARFLGHQLRYDMIYPLLARSPMELWKRQHNYVRQYLTEIVIRPLFAFLVRHRMPPWLAIAASATASYAFIIISHSGWRPWEEPRPIFTSIALSLAFSLFILIPVLSASQVKAKFQSRRWARILLGVEPLTPLRKWRMLDYSFWAVTILIVSFSKACVGLVRAWGISRGWP